MNGIINIEVSRSFLNDTCYCVIARFGDGSYPGRACVGAVCVHADFISRRFWGNSSLEDQIKQATCDAIKALKEEFAVKKAELDEEIRLTVLANNHIQNCEGKL
jgi:hypothetical protein